MRLLIPFRFFPISMKGGIEESAYEIIESLLPHVDAVVILLEGALLDNVRQRFVNTEKVSCEPFESDAMMALRRSLLRIPRFGGRACNVSMKLYWRYLDRWGLQRIARKHRATHCLYLFTRFQGQPHLRIPLWGVIHDMWWHGMPASDALKRREDTALMHWLAASRGVIAVSEKTKREIASRFPGESGKVVAIPHGIHLPDESESGPAASKRPLFYYPAQFKANKSHLTFLKAAEALARQGFDFELVFTGQHSEMLVGSSVLEDARLEACRRFFQDNRSIFDGKVEALGYCSRERVEELYRASVAVVLPSVYEGFGLPFLEGIRRGARVICSDLEVFREQAQRYGCEDMVDFFPQEDAEALAALMKRCIDFPPQKISMSRVREALSVWTWEHTGEAYFRAMNSDRMA